MDEDETTNAERSWLPDINLIVRTVIQNFIHDPGMLFTCINVCQPWSEVGIEILNHHVPDEVWMERATMRYPGAVEDALAEGGIEDWKMWYKDYRTRYNDVRSYWVQLKIKGNNWRMLWMNTQITGLMLYHEYRVNRFGYLNLEKGLDIKKVENKGKQHCAQITTTDREITICCQNNFERENWIKIITEMIQFYNPRAKEILDLIVKNQEADATDRHTTISKFIGKKFINRIGTNLRSTKMFGAPPNLSEAATMPTEEPLTNRETKQRRGISTGKKAKRPDKKSLDKAKTTRGYDAVSPRSVSTSGDYENNDNKNSTVEDTSPREVIAEDDDNDGSFTINNVHENNVVHGPFSLASSIPSDDSRQADANYKVIIIGNSGVGKSNLLGRWMNDKFAMTSVTISADLSVKTFLIDGKVIKVNFWDTAGQEAHFSLTQSYFRQSHGAIIVYDITNTDSFFDVQKWVSAVKDIPGNENTQFLLIGNKADLESSREVTTKLGLDLSKKLNLNFMETSALNGDNVHRAFQVILQDIHKLVKSLPVLHSDNNASNYTTGATMKITSDTPQFDTNTQCCVFN